MSATDLIKRFEGCRLSAYPDPESPRALHKRVTGVDDPALNARPWTIGYGCTGPGIGPDTVWTQEQCEQALEHRLSALTDVVQSLVTVPTTDNQMAALCSLAWNIGSDRLARSTLLRLLNAGDTDGAAKEFLKWDLAAGKVLPGLVKRRIEEKRVFECATT